MLARTRLGWYETSQVPPIQDKQPRAELIMKAKTSPRNFSHHVRSAHRRLVRCAAFGAAATLIATQAQAAFHLWNIREIYTDASGSLQFIELFCPFSGQTVVGGRQIDVVFGGTTHTFMLPAGNLTSDTLNHTLLFGTAGLQAAGGPAPNYTLPNNFLFSGGGTINFFGANSGVYTALPTDGNLSRTWAAGNAVNSPQNFAGQIGLVAVPEPSTLALFATGALGLCCLLRRRSA